MGEDKNRRFDLKSLLRVVDLDIRKVSRNNLSLQVGDYLKQLSLFTLRAPKALEALKNVSAHKAKDNDLRNLEEIKDILGSIGHVKFLPALDEITGSGKRGHTKFAAGAARGIMDGFYELYTRIMSAQKIPNPETSSVSRDADDLTFENYKAQLLNNVLKLLDNEEATRKMRILAVDDSPVLLTTISSLLKTDYDFYGLSDPEKLEDLLESITPELFLLDYKMPVLSGFDLVPIIRAFDEHKETPIIFLTSVGSMDHVSAAVALGACDYIVKPFKENNLREKVAKHIVRKKLF